MKKRAIIVTLGVLALTACAGRVEPPPAPELPATWQDVDAATPSYTVPPRWWRTFDDPVLDRLVELSLQRNLDLAAAGERIHEARAQRRAAGAALYPDIAISASRAESGGDRGDAGTAAGRGGDTWAYGLDLAWEIDVFGRLRALRRAADAALAASAADYQAARLSLVAEVAGNYLELRLAERQLALAESSARAQAETLRLTRARFTQGVADRLDVERLASQLAITEAAIPAARERTATARYTLAFLLAVPQPTIDVLVGYPTAGTRSDLAIAVPRADTGRAVMPVLAAPAEVLRGRPDVIAAERRLAAAGEELVAARAARYPQITLAALGGFERGASGAVWEAEAGLLQPLFDFGRIRAGIESSDARRRQAALAYESALRQALRETQTAIYGYGQALQRQQRLDAAAAAAEQAVSLARRRYQVGTLSLLEVLDAERTLFDVQQDQAEATVAVSQRLVTLYRTLGILPDDAAADAATAATAAASHPAEP